MHVSLDRCKHDFGPFFLLCFSLMHVGFQPCNGLLHHSGAFDDLGKKHFARTKQLPNDVHAVHERSLNDAQRITNVIVGFSDILFDELGDAVNQGMGQPFGDVLFSPFMGVLLKALLF